MRNYNEDIKAVIYNCLKDLVDSLGNKVPIYYYYVPEDFSNNYVLIQSLQTTGVTNKCDNLRNMSFQCVIYTQNIKNDGIEVEKITNNVLHLLRQNGKYNLKLVSDITNLDLNPKGKYITYERILNINLLIQ